MDSLAYYFFTDSLAEVSVDLWPPRITLTLDPMGLFESILGGFVANEAQHSALLSEIGSVLNQSGGVGGLAQQFEQKGLGSIMSGWIGTGSNPPISGEQI